MVFIANSAANYESTMTWFQRASELGHVRSLYWMAKLYLRGQGVERDERKAAALLQQAAAARDPEARRFLRYQSWCQKSMKKRAEKGTAD